VIVNEWARSCLGIGRDFHDISGILVSFKFMKFQKLCVLTACDDSWFRDNSNHMLESLARSDINLTVPAAGVSIYHPTRAFPLWLSGKHY
jgi:hypothetical protein